MVTFDRKALGERAKAARVKLGISQEELAERAGYSIQHISGIETGKHSYSISAIVDVANAIGVTLDDLFCDSLAAARIPFERELNELLNDCSADEYGAIIEAVKFVKRLYRRSSIRTDGEKA